MIQRGRPMVFYGSRNKKGLFNGRFTQITKEQLLKKMSSTCFVTKSNQLCPKSISLMLPGLDFRKDLEFRIKKQPEI